MKEIKEKLEFQIAMQEKHADHLKIQIGEAGDNHAVIEILTPQLHLVEAYAFIFERILEVLTYADTMFDELEESLYFEIDAFNECVSNLKIAIQEGISSCHVEDGFLNRRISALEERLEQLEQHVCQE